MLGRLILILVQLAAGWFLEPMLTAKLPPMGGLTIFAAAAIVAVIVWLTGFIGSVILKDVAQPSAGTLTFALIGALIGAALTLVPAVTGFVAGVIRGGVPNKIYPLVGAVLGYAIKK